MKNTRNSLTLVLICGLYLNGVGQKWSMVDSMKFDFSISAFAIDENDDIYLGSNTGNILRYDENGKQDQLFSGINYASVSIIEPWNRLKVFLFYRENQAVVVLDRFSTTTSESLLSDMNIGFGQLVTPGVDNSLWVLESGTNELRKYSTQGKLIFSTPFGELQLQNATHMRAFKNLLIILDKSSGFFFFDQFGNLLSQLPIKGATYFQITSNKVVTYDGKNVTEFDPFSPSRISRITSPDIESIGVLKSKEYYYFVGTDWMMKMIPLYSR